MRIAVSVSLTIAGTVVGLLGALSLGLSGLSLAGPGLTIIEYSDSDHGERSIGIAMGVIALATWLVMVVSAALAELQKLAALSQTAAPVAVDVEPRPWAVRRRLTDAQIEEIVTKYQSGAGTPKLCDEYGISKPSMLELLHERGVQMRRQPLTKTQRAEAVRLYEEGMAIKPIANELGSSFGAVHRVLKAEEIKLRPRPGR
ncbi:helix-turn-helix domain-containing protein [Microbacterium sp. NPDC089189]|uniref:helix-turn-helix domain-containing protein n=1 Tax=Microbacterium sp. NPDC089189 TaxID=3154972 RepID=UPI0034316025